jgi:hypothetical protein
MVDGSKRMAVRTVVVKGDYYVTFPVTGHDLDLYTVYCWYYIHHNGNDDPEMV